MWLKSKESESLKALKTVVYHAIELLDSQNKIMIEAHKGLLQIKEYTDALIEENRLLKGSIRAQDERNLRATESVGMTPWGCDTPEHLAWEIMELRAELEALRKSK